MICTSFQRTVEEVVWLSVSRFRCAEDAVAEANSEYRLVVIECGRSRGGLLGFVCCMPASAR